MAKTYYEDRERGKYKIIEQDNGIKIEMLLQPSKSELKRLKEKNEKARPAMEAAKKKNEGQRLIQERIRELAIESLKKEGKIDNNGNAI